MLMMVLFVVLVAAAFAAMKQHLGFNITGSVGIGAAVPNIDGV